MAMASTVAPPRWLLLSYQSNGISTVQKARFYSHDSLGCEDCLSRPSEGRRLQHLVSP